MHEQEISLTSASDHDIKSAIDQSIAECGLKVTLRGSLGKYPGSIHWHLKRGRVPGTLEMTFWPQTRRAWFTIQDRRRADWIEEARLTMTIALCRRGIAQECSP